MRLTTQEEQSLLSDTVQRDFRASPMSKDLRDLAECLNSSMVWNTESRPPLEVAISLLTMLINLYEENRGILERFGISGFGLISVQPAFNVILFYYFYIYICISYYFYF